MPKKLKFTEGEDNPNKIKVDRRVNINIKPDGKITKFECPNPTCDNMLENPDQKHVTIVCSVCGESVKIMTSLLDMTVKHRERRGPNFNVDAN